MAKKIPTHDQIKAKAAEKERLSQEQEREQLILFLQDKSLKMIFHFYLGMESLDMLKATNNYSKELKMYGNKFLAALEKHIAPKMDSLYDNQPEFTNNMLSQMDDVAKKFGQILFADYPVINKMADEFNKDPEHWRKNVRMEMNVLDGDLKQQENE